MENIEEIDLDKLSTKEEQKEKALEIMKKLDIFEPYIDGFREDNEVCYYEGYAGFWAYQTPEVIEKLKEIEKEHNCTVYAITHEFTEFGECYDFLLVPLYKDEWDTIVDQISKCQYYAFAYAWNKDYEECSEFGDIAIQSFGGGIRRIA